MNEHEVRDALRGAMVASSPPPPMDTGRAVEAGQKAHRRRQTTRAGIVAGLAVVGIAVGATYLPSAINGGSVEAGSGPRDVVSPASDALGSSPAPMGSSGSTETSWPDGQHDRTATSGPRADKSVDLLPRLAAALPSGLSTQSVSGAKSWTQSQFVDYAANNVQVWEYQAITPALKTDGSGQVGVLSVQVTTKGNTVKGDACEAAARAPGIKGDCDVVDVGGKQVGVLTSNGAEAQNEKMFDQVAAYRDVDGTVVFVGQAKAFNHSSQPALGELPLTGEQLAALATDAQFHLD